MISTTTQILGKLNSPPFGSSFAQTGYAAKSRLRYATPWHAGSFA